MILAHLRIVGRCVRGRPRLLGCCKWGSSRREPLCVQPPGSRGVWLDSKSLLDEGSSFTELSQGKVGRRQHQKCLREPPAVKVVGTQQLDRFIEPPLPEEDPSPLEDCGGFICVLIAQGNQLSYSGAQQPCSLIASYIESGARSAPFGHRTAPVTTRNVEKKASSRSGSRTLPKSFRERSRPRSTSPCVPSTNATRKRCSEIASAATIRQGTSCRIAGVTPAARSVSGGAVRDIC